MAPGHRRPLSFKLEPLPPAGSTAWETELRVSGFGWPAVQPTLRLPIKVGGRGGDMPSFVCRLSNTVWLACVKPTLHLRSTVGRWIPDAVVRRCFPKVFVCFGPSPLYVTRFRSACVCAAFPCSHSCLAARRRACSAGHTTSRLCRWAGAAWKLWQGGMAVAWLELEGWLFVTTAAPCARPFSHPCMPNPAAQCWSPCRHLPHASHFPHLLPHCPHNPCNTPSAPAPEPQLLAPPSHAITPAEFYQLWQALPHRAQVRVDAGRAGG